MSTWADQIESLLQSGDTEQAIALLREHSAAVNERDVSRAEFLALISHELRTPLNAIIGYNSLLNEGIYGEMNEKQHKAVSRIDRNATRLLTLINQLLDLSRLEAGATSIIRENVDVKALVAAVLDDYQSVADEKGLNLVVSQPHRECMVNTDAAKLREVIRQVVSNALKFTTEGRVEISIQTEGNSVSVSIADSGPGVDEDKREAIFELFRRCDQSTEVQKRPDGAGLGLAIVRKLSDLLGVCVQVESQSGVGSTFRLQVPAGVGEPEPIVASESVGMESADVPEQPCPEDPTKECAPSILIVDDDPYTVEILGDYLETKGIYRVIKVYSGMHAMLHLAKVRPSFLLVDLLMPNINGERVIDYCRGLWGDSVQIIVITGKQLSPSEKEALLQRANGILLKAELQAGSLAETLEPLIPLHALS